VSSWRETLKKYLYFKNRALVEKDISWIKDFIIENKRRQFFSLFAYIYEQQKERKAHSLVSTSEIKEIKVIAEKENQVELSLLMNESTLYEIGQETYKQEIEVERQISLIHWNGRWFIEKDEEVPGVFQEAKEPRQTYVYNRIEAVRYAELWWNDYNPKFHRFEDDCTNYVSQCLYAGGIPMEFSYSRSKGWWYRGGENGWSYSWTVANSFKHYLETGGHIRVQKVERPENLTIGDVICYDFDGDGKWQHNTIVVRKDGQGMPLVNAHTTNSRNRYWDYRNSTAYTPNIQYAFFHIM